MAKAKKLTLAELKKLDSQNNQQEEISVQGYTLKIDKVFRQTKINKLIQEYTTSLQSLAEDGIDVVEDFDGEHYMYYLFIKHFTDLSIDDKSDIQKQLQVLEYLLDTGILYDIINEFPEDQVVKVKDSFDVHMAKQSAKMDSDLVAFKNQMIGLKLQNKDILSSIANVEELEKLQDELKKASMN